MKKKNTNNLTTVSVDVTLSMEHLEEFERGIVYFNNGQFQHSFEAWELLWENSEKTQRRFIRGLMDVATGCQQLVQQKDLNAAMANFAKAYEKLDAEHYQPEFLYVPVKPLLTFIEQFRENLKSIGINGNEASLRKLLPKIQFHKPANPDLLVELCEIVRSKEFFVGVRNFNRGYYWESHEIWEEIWREQIGNGKKFIEAFVQLAEAYSFAKVSKINPAIYLFEKSIKRLQEYERVDCNLTLSVIVDEAQCVLNDLQTFVMDGKSQYKFQKNPSITLSNK